jgi:RNA polymerase sigma-70 factor (ECF subfamily)
LLLPTYHTVKQEKGFKKSETFFTLIGIVSMLEKILSPIFQQVSDKKLMLKIQQGKNPFAHAAFNELYHRYHRKIYFYLYHLLTKVELAEEITNETFFTLYHKSSQFDPQRPLLPWLFTISRNKAFNLMAKKQEVLFNEQDPGEITVDLTTIDQQLLTLIADEQQQQIQNALQALPLNQKEALTLWLQECSTKEMASIMQTTPQAVKNLVHRAKQQLILKLKEEQ